MSITKYHCNDCSRGWTVKHPMLFWGKCEWCDSKNVVRVCMDVPLEDIKIEVAYDMDEGDKRSPRLDVEDVIYILGADEI